MPTHMSKTRTGLVTIAQLLLITGILRAAVTERSHAGTLTWDPPPSLGKITQRCKPIDGGRFVLLLKQWQLGSSVDTRELPASQPIPQRANQIALYRMLDQWIATKRLKNLVSEGCEGVLDDRTRTKLQGWSVSDLKIRVASPSYAEIMTSPVFKAEAKYGKDVHSQCGDTEEGIREADLASSDARGAAGFLGRLEEFKDRPERAKTYLDGVVQVYKMPTSTSMPQAVSRLRAELKSALERVAKANVTRDLKMVEALSSLPEPHPAALVVDGAHVPRLIQEFQRLKWNCAIVEPAGYRRDSEDPMAALPKGPQPSKKK